MKTTNIRVYESTHKRLQALAKQRRQTLVVVLDELVKSAGLLKVSEVNS